MIGLALSGGGLKGSYEAGALKAMRECHLHFDGVTGTSIGAFNAAMIASGKEKELIDFWLDVDVASILGLSQEYANVIKSKHKGLRSFSTIIKENFRIFKNFGLNNNGLRKVLQTFNIEKCVANSKMDFGVCTYNINNKKPIELFKEDIPEGKIEEFVLASCLFPIFKPQKMIDDSYYFDGGIYDNCPSNMLIDKGYSFVYRIDLQAIGRRRKIKEPNKTITITPSRKLGPIITLDNKQIVDNFWIGYYDTLKILKKYPGNKYLFQKKPNWYYKFITRKVPKNIKKDLMAIYYAKDDQELLLKILEILMINDDVSYFKIYNPMKIVTRYKHNNSNPLVKNYLKYVMFM